MVKVLVTGASGYLASQIVRHLVNKKKYEVRGTVRSLEKAKHIQELFPEVKLYEADLLIEGSFDKALQDVEIVFHTASPFQLVVKDPQKDLIEPAINGTLNVLKSVDKIKSVKRVVLTSSVAAIARGKPADYHYSEKDWNEESTPTREPYPYSKTAAEKAAWKFSEGKNWKLVTVCPGFIAGPPLSDRFDAVSVQAIKSLLEGKYEEKNPGLGFGTVSVDDVAEAHIAAAEKKEAAGHRYLVTSSDAYTREDFNKILIKSGEFKKFPLEKNHFLPPKQKFCYDNRKVQKELGIELTPVPDTIIAMAKQLIKLNIVKIPAKL